MEFIVEVVEVLTGLVYWLGVLGFPVVGMIIGWALCAMLSPDFSDRAVVLFGISGFICGISFAIMNSYNPEYGKVGFTRTGLVLVAIAIFAVVIKIASSNPSTQSECE